MVGSTSPADVHEQIAAELICCCCLGQLVLPVTLACAHNACKECVIKLRDKSRVGVKVACPICRRVTHYTSLESISVNHTLRNVLLLVAGRSGGTVRAAPRGAETTTSEDSLQSWIAAARTGLTTYEAISHATDLLGAMNKSALDTDINTTVELIEDIHDILDEKKGQLLRLREQLTLHCGVQSHMSRRLEECFHHVKRVVEVVEKFVNEGQGNEHDVARALRHVETMSFSISSPLLYDDAATSSLRKIADDISALTFVLKSPPLSLPSSVSRGIYFTKGGGDVSWMFTDDKFRGLRQSTYHPYVYYAVAKCNVWDIGQDFACPKGYRWASTADGVSIFGISKEDYKLVVSSWEAASCEFHRGVEIDDVVVQDDSVTEDNAAEIHPHGRHNTKEEISRNDERVEEDVSWRTDSESSTSATANSAPPAHATPIPAKPPQPIVKGSPARRDSPVRQTSHTAPAESTHDLRPAPSPATPSSHSPVTPSLPSPDPDVVPTLIAPPHHSTLSPVPQQEPRALRVPTSQDTEVPQSRPVQTEPGAPEVPVPVTDAGAADSATVGPRKSVEGHPCGQEPRSGESGPSACPPAQEQRSVKRAAVCVYFDQGGWDGYEGPDGKGRYHFRFSDSHITWAYKHAGNSDRCRVQLDQSTDEFAGLVLMKAV